MDNGILSKILFNFPEAWKDLKKFKAILLDYYPEDKLTRNLIISSIEEQIPHELNRMTECSNSDFHRLSKRLVDSYGCVESKAEEITMMWMDALGISTENRNPKKMTNTEIANLRIDELELSVRSYNMLKRAGINTIGELMRPRKQEMMGVRNLGSKSLEEVLYKIKALGWNSYDEDRDEDAEKNHPGRDKCDQLRVIRQKIASTNGIDYKPTECHHTGPCMGTCPVCDSEIRYIDEELQKKKMRGEEIILNGLAIEDIKQSGCDTDPDIIGNSVDGGLDTFDKWSEGENLSVSDDDWGNW